MHTHKQSLFLKYSLFLFVYANRQKRLPSFHNVKISKTLQIFKKFSENFLKSLHAFPSKDFEKKKGLFLSKQSLVRETGLEPVR